MREVAVILGGSPWRIVWTTRRQMPRRTWGDCDHHRRVIRVRRDLSPLNRLDTLLHECKHAQHPDLSEDCVDRSSTELAVAVFTAGVLDA